MAHTHPITLIIIEESSDNVLHECVSFVGYLPNSKDSFTVGKKTYTVIARKFGYSELLGLESAILYVKDWHVPV